MTPSISYLYLIIYTLPGSIATYSMSPDLREDSNIGGLIESSPDAIVIANPETGEIIEVNPAAEEFFGYTQAELRAMEVLDLHPPNEREQYEHLFETHFEQQPAVISQFDDGSPVFAVTATGDQIPVEINAWAIENAEQNQPLFHGVFRDVSERLRRQRELQRQNEQLDEFASVISHDLQSPMAVAQGRVALLEQECESEHIDPLQSALSRMEVIVEDTLTLAQQGETVSDMEMISLTELVDDCWERVATADAAIDVVDELTIRGDRSRLKNVFENLFRNAVDHAGTEAGIHVGCDGGQQFYVEDDGPGIEESERETVFDAGHSSRPDGTGFGLTIVKRIVNAHGWEVSIADGENGGARFEFDNVDVIDG